MNNIIKRISSAFFALLLGFSLVAVLPFSSSATEEVEVSASVPELLTTSSTIKVGIDISAWQETVDWAKIKASGVQQAFLRLCTYRNSAYSVDPYLAQNIKGATENGIPIGCYFFSYANSMDEIRTEAQMILNILKDYPATFALPIVFDAESTNIQSFATEACDVFCQILVDNGYYPMVYANSNWFNNYIDTDQISDIDFWQAHYRNSYAGVTPTGLAAYASARPALNKNNDNVTVWQCTDSGTVSGCSGSSNIDMNIFYKDYTQIIPVQGYNGYEANTVKVEPSSSLSAGGSKIPSISADDPNVRVTGLDCGIPKGYWGLETYENNKNLVLLNGRTWAKWDTKSKDALARLWVYPAGEGQYYLGFDLNDPASLRINSQAEGAGEVLESIVLQKGFKFVNIPTASFGTDVDLTNSTNVTGVVGELSKNIMIYVKDGAFRIAVDGEESITTLSTEQYGKVTGNTVNIRSTPDSSVTTNILGTATLNSELEYLGETSGTWCKVKFENQTAWISSTYFTITGPKETTTTQKVDIPGYTLQTDQAVLVTGSSVNVRSTPDSNIDTNKLGVATSGTKLTYLGEQSGSFCKVIFEGQTAWISSKYVSLVDNGVTVIPLNAGWDTSSSEDPTTSTPDGGNEPSADVSSDVPSDSTPDDSADNNDNQGGVSGATVAIVLGSCLAVGAPTGVFLTLRKLRKK